LRCACEEGWLRVALHPVVPAGRAAARRALDPRELPELELERDADRDGRAEIRLGLSAAGEGTVSVLEPEGGASLPGARCALRGHRLEADLPLPELEALGAAPPLRARAVLDVAPGADGEGLEPAWRETAWLEVGAP
jgi:hypothetical protein